MIQIPDIPRDQDCLAVNPNLFRHFQLKLLKLTGNLATPNWSEAEVVQWLDSVDHDAKYLHDTMDQNLG